MVSVEDVEALKVVDLKKHLKDRGLSDVGLKVALQERLKEALASDAPAGGKKGGGVQSSRCQPQQRLNPLLRNSEGARAAKKRKSMMSMSIKAQRRRAGDMTGQAV